MPATTAGTSPASKTDFAEKAIKQLHADIAVDDDVLREARKRRDHVNRQAAKFNGALYAPWLTFPIAKAILGIADEPEARPVEPEPAGLASAIDAGFSADWHGQLLLF